MSKTGKKAAILLDTKGPEIRTIKLEGGEAFIGYRYDFAVADNGFIGGEGESLARFQGDVVCGTRSAHPEPAQCDEQNR
jgi:pyruvate kinase